MSPILFILLLFTNYTIYLEKQLWNVKENVYKYTWSNKESNLTVDFE